MNPFKARFGARTGGALLALVAVSCGQLIGAGSYKVEGDTGTGGGQGGVGSGGEGGSGGAGAASGASGAGGAAMTCLDPTGFNGKGCGNCDPKSSDDLLNHCTSTACTPFDNPSRLTKLGDGGKLPDLPPLAGTGGAGGAGGAGGMAGFGAGTGGTASGGKASGGGQAGSGAGAGPAGSGGGAQVPLCSSLPNPVYVTGPTALNLFLSRIAQALAKKTGSEQITIVYESQTSCQGVDAILNNTPLLGQSPNRPTYWDPAVADLTKAAKLCDLPDGGVAADLGFSDVFATTCFDLPQGLPASVGDTAGPIQVMNFVAPGGSTQESISAEAAYFVYGFGSGSGVTPWTDETYLFRKSFTSGTQGMIGKTIGVDADRFRGVETKGNDDMRAKLLAVPADQQDHALGIMTSDLADELRGPLRELAFQAYHQGCAFHPDSAPGANDKQNVRDGHYPIWGQVHLFSHLNSQSLPPPQVGKIVGYLNGLQQLPEVDILTLYIKNHLIPQCAMHVQRSADGGPITAYASPQPCSCYFDALATGASSCTTCKSTSDCPAASPNCSYGYCEP